MTTNSPTARSTVDTCLDVFVALPLGVLTSVIDTIPKVFARREVEQHLRNARTIGRLVAPVAKRQWEATVDGWLGRHPATPTTATPATAATPTSNGSHGDDRTATTRPATAKPTATKPTATKPTATKRARPKPTSQGLTRSTDPRPNDPASGVPTLGELPIESYDQLSASHVVPRLANMSPAELDRIERYERATRHRSTILTRIEQLRGS